MTSVLRQIEDLIAVLDGSTHQQRQKQKVVICGGGNAAHVFAALAASDSQNEVHLLSLYATEAADFDAALKGTDDGRLTLRVTQRNEEIKAAPSNVTNDPRCLADSDIVVISLPAFAHNQYLKAIKEHIAPRQTKKTLVAVFPGASGLECDWQSIFGAHNDDFALLSCITLPWACRILEFGRCAEILGTKHRIEVSVKSTDDANAKYISSISRLIAGAAPSIVDFGHILNMSLSAINAIVHPSIMFAKWRRYDGKEVFARKPLFYQGMDAEAAAIMSTLSEETLRITQSIEAQTGLALLTQPIYSWYKRCYGDECADTSSLLRTIQTNPGYDGLTHPMRRAPNGEGFVPDFRYRYLSEDIPFGLVVIRGLALILDAQHRAQCECPLMDEIIVWSQKLLGREFLRYNADGSVVAGKDIDKTRAPQRYHIESITELV